MRHETLLELLQPDAADYRVHRPGVVLVYFLY
jgi:hypothetical protein